MHDRDGAWRQGGEAADGGSGIYRDSGRTEFFLGIERRRQDVSVRDRRAVAELKEQIAAEQRPRCFLENQSRVPAVRNVRRVDAPYALAAQIEHLAVRERARWPRRGVVKPYIAADSSMRRGRIRRRIEPFVERTAFVGFHVAERDPSQLLQIEQSRGGGRDRRKEKTLPAMKQHRLVCIDQELIEGDAGGRRYLGDKRGEPVDMIRDLIDSGFHAAHSRKVRKTYYLYVRYVLHLVKRVLSEYFVSQMRCRIYAPRPLGCG